SYVNTSDGNKFGLKNVWTGTVTANEISFTSSNSQPVKQSLSRDKTGQVAFRQLWVCHYPCSTIHLCGRNSTYCGSRRCSTFVPRGLLNRRASSEKRRAPSSSKRMAHAR